MISIVVLASEREIAPIASFLEDRQDFRLVASATLDTNDNDALQLIQRHQPDMVYIDHNFGEKGSWQFAKWVRERYPNMLITMMSLTGDNDWMRRCLLAGANDFLSKPLEKENFFRSAEIVLKQRNLIKILVVTDDEWWVEPIKKFLDAEGGFIVQWSQGATLSLPLDMQSIYRFKLDVVILDSNFTGLISSTRQSLPNAVIIMMEVGGNPDWMRICMRAGADDFLTKPFDKDQVVDTIRVCLKHKKRD